MILRHLWMMGFCLLGNAALADDMSPANNVYTYSGKDASALIASSITGGDNASGVKVLIQGTRDEDTVATASTAINAEVSGLDVDKAHSHWSATLLFTANGQNLPPVKVSGRYEEISQIPVLKRRVQAGDVITEADIGWTAEPSGHIRPNVITSSNDLIGKSPKRVISPNRPVRQDEVSNASVIAKGSHITIFFRSNNLEIKTLGEAMDSGAKGDVIRVKNLASKSIVEGRVESGDLVRVSGMEDTSASAEPLP